jgi:SAM-dependent methyltransferase
MLEINGYPYVLTQILERAFPGAASERTNAGLAGGKEMEHALVDGSGAPVGAIRSRLVDPESEPLPFPDGAFDTVLLCGVLSWLSRDPAAVVAELHRVLEPGGRLVLTTQNAARAYVAGRLADRLGIAGTILNAGRGAPPLRDYAADEVFDLLSGNGFVVERHLTRSPAPLERLDAAWFAAADDEGDGEHHFVVARRADPAGPHRPAWLYG